MINRVKKKDGGIQKNKKHMIISFLILIDVKKWKIQISIGKLSI